MEQLAAEVCIIGAGPAGLVVGQRLLAAGIPCVVLERLASEALCARAKAGMLEPRSVRALAAVDLATPIVQNGTRNGVVEFCVDGERRVFDYAALTGGHGHFVYPQHLLTRAWADHFIQAGGRLSFATEVQAIEGAEQSQATVRARTADGRSLSVVCRAVVLAAGAGSSLLPEGIESHEHRHPFRWLTAMLEMAPLGERTIYATHRNGFAAHLRRSAALTRFYLQVPAADALDRWGDERFRAELELRLGIQGPGTEGRGGDGCGSIHGAIVERDVLDLRVRVREPLQRGCVYLAGDAAHLITPAGGKGMNLAIQDALELSEGLIERFARAAPARLERYSATRLPLIWRSQEFSNWMLTLFGGGALGYQRSEPDPAAGFAHRLHRAQIDRLFAEPGFARWFAHRYAGVDESEASAPPLPPAA